MMTDAYLVVLSAEGVVVITEENAHARHFLLRRYFTVSCGREVCYWTLLPTEKAEAIRWLILHGERLAAHWLLNESALDSGLIVPACDEDSLPEYHLVSH
jgi:hypothetical protein